MTGPNFSNFSLHGVVKFYRFAWMMGRSCRVLFSANLDMYGGNHGGVHPEGSVQG